MSVKKYPAVPRIAFLMSCTLLRQKNKMTHKRHKMTTDDGRHHLSKMNTTHTMNTEDDTQHNNTNVENKADVLAKEFTLSSPLLKEHTKTVLSP